MLRKLQAAARYICHRINEAYGNIIPVEQIDGTYENNMHADQLIPAKFRAKAIELAFDELHGRDVFMTKGLSDPFIDQYVKSASPPTIQNYHRYNYLVLNVHGSKKAYETATNQHKIAENYLNGNIYKPKIPEVVHPVEELPVNIIPVETIQIKDNSTTKVAAEQSILEDLIAISRSKDIAKTEKKMLQLARLGQGKFRQELLELCGCCAVTGCRNPELLIAGHIKPWRISTDQERLNPFNGILLTPIYDRLFDRGFISFSDSGKIIIANKLSSSDMALLGVKDDIMITMREMNIPYMREHRRCWNL